MHSSTVSDNLQQCLTAWGGVASRPDLARLGLSSGQVKRLVRDEILVRYRREVFICARTWNAATPWEQHELRARAVAALLCGPGGPYLLSHHSALAVAGVGVFGTDDRVHMVRTDGKRGRADDSLQVHAPVPERWVAREGSVPSVTVALACLQVAATYGALAGLVSTDAALRQGLTSTGELELTSREGSFGHGVAEVRATVEEATGLSGSGGESRCRWVLRVVGLPRPELQVPVVDEAGKLLGIVDFLFRDQWTIVEFDGALKYTSPDAIYAEKRREDALRALGYEVVRITWADLSHSDRVLAKVRAAFSRAAARKAA